MQLSISDLSNILTSYLSDEFLQEKNPMKNLQILLNKLNHLSKLNSYSLTKISSGVFSKTLDVVENSFSGAF